MREGEAIIQTAVDLFKFSREELLGDSRTKYLIPFRHALFYALRTLTNLSYPELSRLTGFDHTTIMYAVVKVREEIYSGGSAATEAQRLLLAQDALPVSVEFY